MELGEAGLRPRDRPGTTIAGFPFGSGGPLRQPQQPDHAEQADAQLSTALTFDAPPTRSRKRWRRSRRSSWENSSRATSSSAPARSKKPPASSRSCSSAKWRAPTPLTATWSSPALKPVLRSRRDRPARPVARVSSFGGFAPGTPQFTEAPGECPDASKIGTVRSTPRCSTTRCPARSTWPAQRQPVRLAAGALHRRRRPGLGRRRQAARQVEADPQTGQLTATFDETPQLPFEDLELEFFKGATAPLKTAARLRHLRDQLLADPLDGAGRRRRRTRDTFVIDHGAGAAPASQTRPRRPTRRASRPARSTRSPAPTRPSSSSSPAKTAPSADPAIDTTLPKGLLGKLAGVPYCSDAALAAAAAQERQGRAGLAQLPGRLPGRQRQRRRRRRPDPVLRRRQGLPRRPLQGRPAEPGGRHPGGRRPLRPRHRGGPHRPLRRPRDDPDPRRLRPDPDDPRRGSRSTSARSRSTSTAPSSPSTRPAATRWRSRQRPPRSSARAPRSPTASRSAAAAALGFKPKLALSLKGGTKRAEPPGAEGGAHRPRRRRQHRPRLGHPAALGVPRQGPHRHVCTRVQFAADACPAGLDLRQGHGLEPAARPARSRARSTCAAPPTSCPTWSPTCNGQIDVDLDRAHRLRSRAAASATPSKRSPTPRSPNSSWRCRAARRACWKTAATSASRRNRATVAVRRPERQDRRLNAGADQQLQEASGKAKHERRKG